MEDILGIPHTTRQSAGLASSAFASFRIGRGDKLNLVQNVGWQYGSQVAMLFEVGSSDVMFQAGRSSGQLELGRIVGEDGFYPYLTADSAECGFLGQVNLAVHDGKCAMTGGKNGDIAFATCIIQTITGGMSADQIRVVENASCMVAGMTRGNGGRVDAN